MTTFAARSGGLLDWAFWLWAIVGVGFGFFVTAIGVLTVPLSLVMTMLLLRRPRIRASAYGLAVGVGAVLLLIAYINRDGPFNARHWLLAGLAFSCAGLIGQVWAARPSERAPRSSGTTIS